MKVFVSKEEDKIILEQTSNNFVRTVTLESNLEEVRYLESLIKEKKEKEVSKFLQEKIIAQIEEVKKSIKVRIEKGTQIGLFQPLIKNREENECKNVFSRRRMCN